MLNENVKKIGEAGSIKINQMVYDLRREGRDVVVLSLGEAFFDIPMFDFGALDFNRGYHYSDTRGFPALREKISSFYDSQYGVKSDPAKNILISTGSKACVYFSILAAINPGEEVMIQEPYWVSYPEQTRLCQGVTKVVPYWIKGAGFAEYFTPKTRLVILNNPNNPAGSLYTPEDLKIIYDLCKKHGAYLLVDEAYSDFCLDGGFKSAGLLDKTFSNLIVVNSLSKNMGMSGWRLGYMFSNPEFIYQVLKINQHLITCAPTILQQYIERYFDDILKCTLPQVSEVVKKRAVIAKYMDSIDLKYIAGSTTFYFFVDISKCGKKSVDFAEWLMREYSIAVVPGSCYGESTDGFVRIGVGTEPVERIQSALNIIRRSWK